MIEQHCSQCTFPISKCNCGSNLIATDSTKPILAHSLSEYKRLSAQGADVLPPQATQPAQPELVRPSHLEACPFCGSKEPMIYINTENRWEIACDNLDCLASITFKEKDLAVKAWNTRTSERLIDLCFLILLVISLVAMCVVGD